ncbi:MAG TPA: CHAD domain-containing protein [Chitinophagaceae bacterium]|nr:CHAD domain-containing protein [Chitinophagaceae bacterium]
MLSKKAQIRFLMNELAGIISFFTALDSLKPGKKEIHDLRINVKKIKALLEVNKIRGYDAGSLTLHRMNNLFRTAGNIRNSQVILTSIQKTEIKEKKIIAYHENIIRENAKKLLREIPGHLNMINDFREELVTFKLKSISNKDVLLYHEVKSDYLKKIFKEPLNPDTLHEGRKQIKHILYLQEMIHPPTLDMIPLNFGNLDKLQVLIGKWHDAVVLLDFVREFKSGKKNKGLKSLVQQQKKQFEEIRTYLLDKKYDIYR